MKAIILAAGMGTRLGAYTKNSPKCMLNFLNKPLIERQVDVLRACGINDIIVVTGYQSNKIKLENVKYYHNKNFAQTNMVESLFTAEEQLQGEILVVYSDIIFEKSIIEKILQDKSDIGATVDDDYWEYWQARLDDPESDIESLVIDRSGDIVELGRPCQPEKARVRYVGLIKFSSTGTQILKKVYHMHRKQYYDSDEAWLDSKSFKQGYMTSMLQAIINEGYSIKPIKIKRGWLEFDTTNDYERASQWAQDGTINRFIKI